MFIFLALPARTRNDARYASQTPSRCRIRPIRRYENPFCLAFYLSPPSQLSHAHRIDRRGAICDPQRSEGKNQPGCIFHCDSDDIESVSAAAQRWYQVGPPAEKLKIAEVEAISIRYQNRTDPVSGTRPLSNCTDTTSCDANAEGARSHANLANAGLGKKDNESAMISFSYGADARDFAHSAAGVAD